MLINIILEYSPKEKKANPTAEYSTLQPETSSASASGKSKGARLVSAKIEIKNKIVQGNNGKINQPNFCCAITISPKFNEPANKITGKINILKETSYDII